MVCGPTTPFVPQGRATLRDVPPQWQFVQVIHECALLVVADGEAVAEAVGADGGEELAGQAHGHLQGVGAVVVVGNGELLELVVEDLGRGAVGLEADATGGQHRTQAADADALVGVVAHTPGMHAMEALAKEGRGELGGQEFLVLVVFDAEDLGMELAVEFHPVGHHLGRGTTGHVGLDEEDSLRIDPQQDEGRVVAPLGVAPLAGIEGQDPDLEILGPLVEPDSLLKVALGPLAEVGIQRRVLFFPFEGGTAALGAEAHEGVEVFDLRPEDGGAFVHGLLVALVEGVGRLTGFGIRGLA